jgi:WD40 repeat protein
LTSLAFSPDGSRLATASTSGMATVWDPATGTALFNLEGHTGIVWDISFSPDGREIATASLDGTAIVWNVDAAAGPSGQEKMTLTGHNGPLTRVAYSPDGQHLATASMDGTVRVYVLGAEQLLELARGRVTRSLTTAECREYLHQEACPDRP